MSETVHDDFEDEIPPTPKLNAPMRTEAPWAETVVNVSYSHSMTAYDDIRWATKEEAVADRDEWAAAHPEWTAKIAVWKISEELLPD